MHFVVHSWNISSVPSPLTLLEMLQFPAPGRVGAGVLVASSQHCFLSAPLPIPLPKAPTRIPTSCRGPTLTGRSKGLEALGLQQGK